MQFILVEIIKGIIMAMLYLEITKANDLTIQNVFLYAFFYIAMVSGARLTGVDPLIITNAFMTKTVFTLVDDRIKDNSKSDRV